MALPITLPQVLSALDGSFRSIDLRPAAVTRSDGVLEPVLVTVRISGRSVAVVKADYADLDERFGLRSTKRFQILREALPFAEITRVFDQLARVHLDIEGKQLAMSWSVAPAALPSGTVSRHQPLLRQPRTGGTWPGISYTAGSRSKLYDSPELAYEIQGSLGFGSVRDAVDVFLDMEPSTGGGFAILVHVEKPARIDRVRASGRKLSVEVLAEAPLQSPRLFLTQMRRHGIGDGHPLRLVGTLDMPPSTRDDDRFWCTLADDRFPELDGILESLRHWRAVEEAHPLIACLEMFWDLDDQLVGPLTARPPLRADRPTAQTEYQRAVADLMTLGGFQTINLGRHDRIRRPGSDVDLATLDVLAHQAETRILGLCACTVGVPKTEDYDKLLHATELVRQELFSTGEVAVRFVPILFCGQETEPIGWEEAARHGLVVNECTEGRRPDAPHPRRKSA